MTRAKSLIAAAAIISACGVAQTAVAATPAAPAAKSAMAAKPAAAAAPAAAGKMALPIKNAAGAAMSGDLVNGKKIFKQCETCHVTTPGVNKVGPSLHGIIGRHSGTIVGFNYSGANKKSGITWTPQELFNYLENPQKRIPGTFMTFTGVKDPQQRADVIAYLIQNTK